MIQKFVVQYIKQLSSKSAKIFLILIEVSFGMYKFRLVKTYTSSRGYTLTLLNIIKVHLLEVDLDARKSKATLISKPSNTIFST
jgi:hypothetical protein